MKNKRLIILGSIVFFIMLSLPMISFAEIQQEQSKVYEITFQSETLSFSKLGDYDIVNLPDCIFTRFVGSPQLPHKVLHFIIPEEKEVSEVKIIEDLKEGIPGQYNIYPAQESVEIGKEQKFTPPKPKVYGLSKYFPAKIIEKSSQGRLSGVNITSLSIYPLQYLPTQKKLLLHKKITFQLIYADKTQPEPKVNQTKKTPLSKVITERFLKRIVFDPEDVEKSLSSNVEESNIPLKGGKDGSVDYLIITNETLKNIGVFQPLLNSRQNKGYATKIESVFWIETNYTGRDTPEKIRNYIKDLYINNGLIYVLLGGDVNIIPPRYADPHIYEMVPCDMYYSDLDSSWDGDGDSVFGEPEDNVDLYPDVFVGRAPVENQQEAEIFVNKILTFESNFFDYNDKALFIGADDFGDAGGTTKDLIDTLYMPPRFDPITKLYERDGTENRANVLSALNQGQFLVNHIDHADIDKLVTGNDYISIDDVDSLANAPHFSILWSCGCFPAAIDYDCIAEHWVTNPNGGGIAFVGNSRNGLNPESDGMLDPEFYKSLFSERIYRIGETLADSKVTFIPEAQSSEMMRFAMYELNLLGDPLTTLQNEKIRVPQDYPTINDAINAAQPRDTILVSPGTYYETVYINKSDVDLIGLGASQTFIEGRIMIDGNSSPEPFNQTISGFTIHSSSWGITLSNEGANPTITNNIIKGCNYAGISCNTDASPKIINNTIVGNNSNGIELQFNCSPIIRNNVITNNYPHGIYAYNSFPVISYNNVWNNSGGNYYGCSAGIGDISVDPKFVNSTDFHLKLGSPSVDKGDSVDDYSLEPQPNGNRINQGSYGNTPEATIIYVPPNPCPCFIAGTPILLADGTLKPIQKVKAGDLVMSFDEKAGKLKQDKVKETFKHKTDKYLIVNGHLKVTENHPVYSNDEWIEIGKLKIGDKLTDSKGKPETIVSIKEVKKKVSVYNLEVNPYHTYIAGGILVHNKPAPGSCLQPQPAAQ